MNLMNFKKTDDAIKVTTKLAFVFCVITSTAFVICFCYLSNRIDAVYSKTLVMDTTGQIYSATALPSADMRKYEYINHVKTFVGKWYSFDEYTYENNIKSGLCLIGDMGKELLNDYKSVSMQNSLMQKNIKYGVMINDIVVDMNTLPVSGTVVFTQTGFRAGGSSARDISVSFTLYDVSRSKDNPHGTKIEDWVVSYSEPRESTIIEHKANVK